jgi:hypothetical protein
VGEEGCGVVAGTGQGEILDGDEGRGGKQTGCDMYLPPVEMNIAQRTYSKCIH